ncbi:MAG: glycosyltransferase [Acidimicrobiales bacterium]
MRVALVSEHASPLATLGGVDAGGQNVHVAALAVALARQGAEVVVHTRRDDPGLPPSVELAPGATVEHLNAGPPRPVAKDDLVPHMGALGRALLRSWTARRPDVVHAHFWMSGMASVAAATGLGVPVVQTFHALGVVKRRHQGAGDTSPPQRESVEADLAQRVDRVVATASEEVFELVRMGADPTRITVVPCGVDVERFSPDGPVEPRPGPGRRRVVVVSRLVARKGVDDVIAALPRLPDVELVVAGGPDVAGLAANAEARRLRRLAAAAGVADRVDLRGRVAHADLPALLRSADAVACVPRYEPFGLVALEAMACGVPVVATAVGGLCDTVVDGVTGFHVRPADPAGVAAALDRVLGDTALAARLGTAGRARTRTRYRWDHVARSTLSVYTELTRPGLLAGTRGRR